MSHCPYTTYSIHMHSAHHIRIRLALDTVKNYIFINSYNTIIGSVLHINAIWQRRNMFEFIIECEIWHLRIHNKFVSRCCFLFFLFLKAKHKQNIPLLYIDILIVSLKVKQIATCISKSIYINNMEANRKKLFCVRQRRHTQFNFNFGIIPVTSRDSYNI